MIWFAVAVSAMVAGIVQSATGFGAAIVMMLIFPLFFGIVPASALASAIAMGVGISLAWKFRKYIDWKLVLPPTGIFLLFSLPAIELVQGMDLTVLTLVFGGFLVVLAVWFFLFSQRVQVPANWKTASVCSALSGVISGLFGIGGPLMAIYFVSATKEKETYIGTIQFLFGVTNIVNLLARVYNGIYTLELLPFTLVGIGGILVGKVIGLKILDCMDPDTAKKVVYAFVGIAGLITIVQKLC